MIKPNLKKPRKIYKGRFLNRISNKINFSSLSFGSIGLKTLTYTKITAIQFETFYNALNKFIKRAGQIKLFIFPHLSVTKKPNEIRMGKGKGYITHWMCKVKPGTKIVEIESYNLSRVLRAIHYARYRLPVSVRLVYC